MSMMANPQFLAGIANGVGQAAGQLAGQMAGTAAGNLGGRVAGAGLNSSPVFDTLNRAGVQLDPNQQAKLANQFAREAGQDAMNQQMQGQAFSAGLGNTAANLNTERAMALNAQANAANNVANQLSALSQARATNANAISNAMNTAAGMFR